MRLAMPRRRCDRLQVWSRGELPELPQGIVTVTGLAVRLETSETGGMKPPPDPHYRHRFPAEIISHAVWLYHVFSLSLRDVELILAERGVVVSYETVRAGARNSARPSPTACDAAGHDPGTSGTWTRCSSGSRACSIIFGAPSIRMASCSTSSFSHGAMARRPNGSFDGC